MTQPNRIRLSKLTLGLLAALATAPVFAQSTSAGVGGQVLGADGQPVAGAQVTIVHDESGTVSRVVTDAEGRYNARGLRVGGPYTVTVNKAGAGSTSEDDVYLQLNQVATVDAYLNNDVTTLDAVQAVGALAPEIFSSDKMGTGTNVDQQQIEALPSIQRSIQDYMRLDPRLAQTDKGRGEISAGGQNTRFNAIRIDGVSTNDPFGLESNNLPTLRQPVSMDAIEAINIDLANYDTTIAGGTGAVVNAVTKSGTNEFDGTAYYVFRDNSMVRENEDGTDFAGFNDEETYGFTLGGPIVKDKLFFFANYEKFTRAAPGPAYGPIGSSASNIVDITPEQIAEAQQIARDVYGIDIGSFTVPGDLETNVEEYAVKLDWNISDFHRASMRYSKMEQVDANLPGLGENSLSLNSYWYDHAKTFESTVVQLFSDWSMDFSTEFKLSTRDYSAIREPLGNPMPSIGINLGAVDNVDPDLPGTGPFLNFGTEVFSHINRVETEQLSAFGAGTWYAGDHAIKFGFDWEKNDIFNLFGRDLFGSYTFADLEHFRNGQYSEYSSRRPLPGESFESIAADFSYENLGLFVQDDWSVTDNLTLMYGVRMDTPSIDESPRKNELIERIYGLDNTATIDGQELIQPRFGFNYTFDSERPTQLRGGVGLFQGAAANVWIGNSFQNAGFTPQIYGLDLSDYDQAERDAIWAQYPFTPDPANQPIVEGGQQMVVALMDPELEQPSVWKANLAFDHQLPWYGVVFSAEALLTSVETGLHYEILGLGDPTAVGPDGRLSYWCDPETSSGGDRCNSGDAIAALRASGQLPAEFENITDWGGDNVIYLRPTNKGEGQQLTVSLAKPLTENWGWMFGYTYTQATEVNPLTSSQAHSNWDGRAILNPNTPTADTSNYEIRDRFTGALTWRKPLFGDYNTSVAVFYEGRSGRPYSWTYLNDANGDSETNDLFYVPSGPGDVIFTGGAEMEAAFFDWLAAHPELSRYKGGVAPRNSAQSSFVNTFDVRISQELPGFWKGHKSEIWLDIMNFGNLLNKDWGQINEIGFPHGRRVADLEGIQDGKYVYSFDPDDVFTERLYDNTGQSRWALQVGFRYKF
ncbi:TonB-dependent receptor domain-containing protein [Lysobacter sp. F6437]|uniref:TonB-dependent receptor domain-containing protein n=1 Tax=Lysobacter sp. F6437 TaxID=3459296 RepID=UPI00403E0E4E